MFHLRGYKPDLTKEINEIYLHSFLFKLAEGLVSIFIPFYILEMGFSILTVLVFFAIYYGMNIITPYPLGVLASKIGYKHTSLLSSVFILGFYLIIRAAEAEPLLFLSAVLGGLGFNTYWAGMNPEFAEGSDEEDTEKESGIFFSLPSIASVFAPMIGGITLYFFSFSLLFLVTATLMLVSFIPFAYSSENTKGMDTSFENFATRDMVTDFFTYFFEGAHSVGERILWPIYLATVIGGSINIGGAGSMIAVGSAVMSVTVGKYTNPENRAKVLITGATLSAITLILMSQVTTITAALAVSALHGLTYKMVNLPIFSGAVRRAQQKEDLIEYFIIRQIAFGIGKVLFIGVITAIYLIHTENLYLYGFAIIAAAITLTGYLGGKIKI